MKILFPLLLVIIIACNNGGKKTVDKTDVKKPIHDTTLQVDSFGITNFNTTRRFLSADEENDLQVMMQRGGNGGRPKPPPPPTTRGVILLMFNGAVVSNTSWNYAGTIFAQPSGLSLSQQQLCIDTCIAKYARFNVFVTTDTNIYNAAPVTKRMRCIVTQTSDWYGNSGGVAFVGSFAWGDNTPCWVFSLLLNYNTKYISEGIVHEVGHTLGLYHHSVYDSACNKIGEYNYGSGNIAPILGCAYYQNMSVWSNSFGANGCVLQNDTAVIKTVLQ